MNNKRKRPIRTYTLKKKILFYLILLISVVFLIECFSFAAFYVFDEKWFSFSRINSERNLISNETDIHKLISSEIRYNFLDHLESAIIVSENPNLVRQSRFMINNSVREVLFLRPNSEVIFKNLIINEDAELKFGIGINQIARDKPSDGVLFEIVVVDENSQNHVIFSRFIDPKNNVRERKWFDGKVSLSAYAGEMVSFIFKTTGGPKGNLGDDLAGWSGLEIISRRGTEKGPWHLKGEVIHPYIGFVYNPESNNEGTTKYHDKIPISRFGFLDKIAPIHTKSDDKLIIGIFGGSLAFWFSTQGIDSLIDELRKCRIFNDKEIVVVRVALGGYKQPQQLMALNYLLALGAHFDIIVNIDGFNEVALPISENIPKNVLPFFPRNWIDRIQDLPDPAMRSIVGEITYLKSKRGKWASVFSKAPLRYSIALNLIWKYYDRNLAMDISRDQLALQNYNPKVDSYVATGPPYQYENESDLFNDLASVWKLSSLQMHKISTANGVGYFHFLQPNQYVSGSKKMGQEELKLAFLDEHPYKKGVEKGYSYLIKAGEELVDQRVKFHDLTMIFADTAEPIYADTCCHVNKKGNEILGVVIGKAIIEDSQCEKIAE